MNKNAMKQIQATLYPDSAEPHVSYSGPRAALIAAGLVTAKQCPEEIGDRHILSYSLGGSLAFCAKHEGYWSVRVNDPQPAVCKRVLRVTLDKNAPPFVQDYLWGCIYTGTKAQLLRCGVIDPKDWPSKKKAKLRDSIGADSSISRKDNDRSCSAEVSGDFYPTNTTPGDVRVHYEAWDFDVSTRIEEAISAAQKVGPLSALQITIIRSAAQKPLSELLRVESRKGAK